MTIFKRITNPGRIAVALSAIGLMLALSATAFSRGSAVPGTGGVKADDIAAQAVNSKKIRDFNVGSRKLKMPQTTTATETIEAGTSEAVTAQCQDGQLLLSGGSAVGADIDVEVIRSKPIGTWAWEVFAHNYSGANAELTAYAYCLP